MGNYAGFSQVELTKPKKSSFDLSHQVRLSTRMGRLTPILCIEAVPSDIFNGSSEILVRLAPLLAPIYDQVQVYVHFYFVANRIIYDEWETMITGGRLGAEVSAPNAPIPPFADIGALLADGSIPMGISSLADYLGVPIFENIDPVAANYNDRYIDVMPFAAYQQVYMDYYRDRNFVPDELAELPLPLQSGELNTAISAELFQLRTRSYEHEYFTSALPFTQRGSEVLMPLAGTGSVTYHDQSVFRNSLTDAPFGDGDVRTGVSGGTTFEPEGGGTELSGYVDNINEVLLTASSVGMNDFRSAYALQVWLERNAIAGSRYTESTQAHFGVKPQDSRLQRAEYIGGGRIAVKISEVVSTAYSEDGTGTVPLANMAGHGISYGNTNRFRYFCPEHGFIIGIASIMNPPSYHQGLSRMFRRKTFLDYPWPTFANLGEQQVDKAELYASPANMLEDAAGNLPLFGYQSRYADWKYICSRNAGEFHTTLLFWTLTRDFADSPELGQVFNEFEDAVQDRIFAVAAADNFWLYVHNKVNVKRPLPYFGKPNTLGFGS